MHISNRRSKHAHIIRTRDNIPVINRRHPCRAHRVEVIHHHIILRSLDAQDPALAVSLRDARCLVIIVEETIQTSTIRPDSPAVHDPQSPTVLTRLEHRVMEPLIGREGKTSVRVGLVIS